jgi:hypothetical protein
MRSAKASVRQGPQVAGRFRADALGGGRLAAQFGVGILQRLQLPHERVVRRIAQDRRVLDEVRVVGLLDPAAEVGGARVDRAGVVVGRGGMRVAHGAHGSSRRAARRTS